MVRTVIVRIALWFDKLYQPVVVIALSGRHRLRPCDDDRYRIPLPPASGRHENLRSDGECLSQLLWRFHNAVYAT
jgi:hypothetical protein